MTLEAPLFTVPSSRTPRRCNFQRLRQRHFNSPMPCLCQRIRGNRSDSPRILWLGARIPEGERLVNRKSQASPARLRRARLASSRAGPRRGCPCSRCLSATPRPKGAEAIDERRWRRETASRPGPVPSKDTLRSTAPVLQATGVVTALSPRNGSSSSPTPSPPLALESSKARARSDRVNKSFSWQTCMLPHHRNLRSGRRAPGSCAFLALPMRPGKKLARSVHRLASLRQNASVPSGLRRDGEKCGIVRRRGACGREVNHRSRCFCTAVPN